MDCDTACILARIYLTAGIALRGLGNGKRAKYSSAMREVSLTVLVSEADGVAWLRSSA